MAADSKVLKRQREEVEGERETLTLEAEQQHPQQRQQQTVNIKRQKSSSSSSSSSSTSSSSCNETPSFLEEDQEQKLTQQDLSSLISTLQQGPPPSDNSPANPLTSSATSELESDVASAASDEEVEDRERVLRHLLEASDDELGLPSRHDGTSSSSIVSESSPLFSVNGGDDMENLSLANSTIFDVFWELEDEAANYYTLLQSELFMERDEHGVNY